MAAHRHGFVTVRSFLPAEVIEQAAAYLASAAAGGNIDADLAGQVNASIGDCPRFPCLLT